MSEALKYAIQHQADWVQNLIDLSKIPSVSFDGFDPSQVKASANCVENLMHQAGLKDVKQIHLKEAHPYVFGQWCEAKNQPTILLYAHHDVQPPMREDIWESPPFTPTERNGRLYGRGCADDKSGVIVHLASIQSYLKTQTQCPVNIKVLIEGEEEIGSPHLEQFLEEYAELLSCDAVIVMDLQNYAAGTPTLTNSLRGMSAFEIELQALEQPLHSGLWGGPLPDPVLGLTRLLASLSNDQGQVAIPGFTNNLSEPTEQELKSWRELNFNAEEFKQQAGLMPGCDFPADSEAVFRKLWREPTLTIHAFQGGSKQMCGNVIQDKAWARVGVRLAPNMDPMAAQSKLKKHLEENCPWGLHMKLDFEAPARPWLAPTDHPIVDQLMQALTQGYERQAVFTGCGATIPLAEPMSKILGNVPVCLVGIEDPDSKAHSENESLLLSEFEKAIKSQILFFETVAKQNYS
jgi:acetylornithine deacetylase/succinyl-diaminopimelate desuccinylase-like protein